MNSLVIPSPAKINLFLKVVGKRPDGYHEIITLLCRIGLFDTVALAFNRSTISVECAHPRVPEDKSNLAHRAASLFLDALSIHDGVAIFIDKVIPVAAGLGGGSSNAAAVLMGLNQHYGLPLADQELGGIALKVGADVPFFLVRHSAIARGIGDYLEVYKDVPPLSVVLVRPTFEVSTSWVYKNLSLGLTNCEKSFKYHCFEEAFSKVIPDFLVLQFPIACEETIDETNPRKCAAIQPGPLQGAEAVNNSTVTADRFIEL